MRLTGGVVHVHDEDGAVAHHCDVLRIAHLHEAVNTLTGHAGHAKDSGELVHATANCLIGGCSQYTSACLHEGQLTT